MVSDIQGDILMVKFNRSDLVEYIENVLGITDPPQQPPCMVSLTITGEIIGGPGIVGVDEIRVTKPGKGKK